MYPQCGVQVTSPGRALNYHFVIELSWRTINLAAIWPLDLAESPLTILLRSTYTDTLIHCILLIQIDTLANSTPGHTDRPYTGHTLAAIDTSLYIYIIHCQNENKFTLNNCNQLVYIIYCIWLLYYR